MNSRCSTNAAPGQDLWEYRYTVSGFTYPQDFGFTVFFAQDRYSDLEDPPPPVNADWDVLTLQPIPAIPADVAYDALALVANPSLADLFTVSFVWLGPAGTQPGAQPFEVYELDLTGSVIDIPEVGQTVPAAQDPGQCPNQRRSRSWPRVSSPWPARGAPDREESGGRRRPKPRVSNPLSPPWEAPAQTPLSPRRPVYLGPWGARGSPIHGERVGVRGRSFKRL